MTAVLGILSGLRLGEAALLLASLALQGRLLLLDASPPRRRRRRDRARARAAKPQPPAEDDAAPSEPPPVFEAPLNPPPGSAAAAEPPAPAPPSKPVPSLLLSSPRVDALARAVGAAALSRLLGASCALLTALHLRLEGARWQLYPLYGATAGALATERLLRGAPRAAAASACLLCSACSALATLAFPWFALPRPSGRFFVGRLTRVLVDDARGAWVTPDKGGPRRLLCDVWYPAQRSACPRVPYMDAALAKALSAAFLGPRATFVASHFARVGSASRRDAPCAPCSGPGFPCVLFSHGNVSTRLQNTGLLEELASHGYVCLAMDHPHDAAVVVFPDGSRTEFEWELPDDLDAAGVLAFRAKQVALRAQDLEACLDMLRELAAEPGGPLEGRVDTSRAAVVGHSFGGASAAQASRSGLFRGAVLLDAWQWPLGSGESSSAGPSPLPPGAAFALPCPALLFESDTFLGDRDAFCAFNSRMSSAMALASPAAWKVIARCGHYEYTDLSLTAPRFMRRIGLLALLPGELRTFERYQSSLVLSFLEAHVRPSPPGDAAAWAPAEGRFASLCTTEALRQHVYSPGYSGRERAAMRLLFRQVRRGDYEQWRVARELDASGELPRVLSAVIHTHGQQSIRELMSEIAAEEGEAMSGGACEAGV